MKALLCARDASARALLVTVLTRCGHDLTVEEEPEAALARQERTPHPLVLIADEAEASARFCARLRRLPKSQDVVLLALAESPTDVPALLEAGANDWLARPALSPLIGRWPDARIDAAVRLVHERARHREAQEALARSEERFRSLFYGAPIGLALSNQELRLLTMNQAFCDLLGYRAEELVGRTIAEITHPDDVAENLELARRSAAGQAPSYRMEKRYLHKSGKVVWGQLTGSFIYDGAGRLLCCLGMVEDITEKKQLQAQLQLSDRMASLGTLAAGVAHEINNPLAYVLSNLRLLEEELGRLPLPPAEREPLQALLLDALEGADRVRCTARDLMTFARPEEPARAAVDVRAVLDSACNMAQNEIRHRARLTKDYRTTPAVRATPSRLGQVFLNLLVNAAHSIAEGDADRHEIRVCTWEGPGGAAVIEVRDTGCGIAVSDQASLFDPFFTTKPPGAGTGLGLYICHGIVTGLGGEITVESEPGRGSAFRVTLPGAASGAEGAQAMDPQEPDAAPPPAGRILVVDDDPLVGRAVQRMLAGHHAVEVVTSGRGALGRLGEGARFDVVLCDLMMPVMTGMELYREVAERDPDLAARMVFVTGGAFTSRAQSFLDDSGRRCLLKPLELSRLEAVIREVMARRPS